MKVENYLTYIDNPEDVMFLRTKLLDVNMRLFNSNQEYKDIVLHCCELIRKCALTKMEGYKLPHGMSGANVGIPFNIIGIVQNRGESNVRCEIFINPKIVESFTPLIKIKTNCGSIRLEKPIEVNRFDTVRVTYFELDGVKHEETFDRENGSFTIQHEIDHNLGILITDRQTP